MVSNKEWVRANPEKIKTYRRKHYEKYREQILAKNKIYKQANAEKGRSYARHWNDTNRDRVKHNVEIRHNKLALLHDQYLATCWCLICGENDIRCLDWHHRNPDEKETSICLMLLGDWSWTRIKLEIEKCNCLCANCHRIYHYEELTRKWKHGAGAEIRGD